MEENYKEEPGENTSLKPIYSKMAVLSFCLFFNPVFGGMLLRQNLLDINDKLAALRALMFSISIFFLSCLLSTSRIGGMGTLFASNLIGGAILVEYFYKKYFPDEANREKKSIKKPLFISLTISLIFVAILYFVAGKNISVTPGVSL